MAKKSKEVILDEAKSIYASAQDVGKSGAYLYPFKVSFRPITIRLSILSLTSASLFFQGIFYFLTHKGLWGPFVSRLGRTIVLGLSVTSFMFFFTYMPQMALMAFTSGPLAAISAALLVLSESSTITTFLSRSLIVEDALIDTFDGTLIARNQEALVAHGRQIQPRTGGKEAAARLGKLLTRPLAKLSPRALLRSLIYLPLNLIPVVGTALYITVQGKRVGPGLHERYFQLKGWNAQQREDWVKKNQEAYTG